MIHNIYTICISKVMSIMEQWFIRLWIKYSVIIYMTTMSSNMMVTIYDHTRKDTVTYGKDTMREDISMDCIDMNNYNMYMDI